MDLEPLLAVLGVVLGASTSGVGIKMHLDAFKRNRIQPRPLDDLLADLSAATLKAQELAGKAQVLLAAEIKQVEKLKSEARDAQQLASISKADADAISQQLGTLLAANSKKASRGDRIRGWLFFIGGSAVTLGATLFIRPLWN